MVEKLEVICQDWTEFEREEGWGCDQHYDGISIHLNQQAYSQYMDENWNNRDMTKVPDYYVAPTGDTYKINIGAKLFDLLNQKGDKTIRYFPTQIKKDLDSKLENSRLSYLEIK